MGRIREWKPREERDIIPVGSVFGRPEHLDSFDIYERKVPAFKEDFPYKTLGRPSDEQ